MNLAPHGRKLPAAITLVTLQLSALFLARGTTDLVAGLLLPRLPHTTFDRARARSDAPGATLPDSRAILARNIFDPTIGPLWPPRDDAKAKSGAPAPVVPEQPQPGVVPRPCVGALRMIGAMHFERAPEWSFATLGTGTQDALCREGARIGDKEVVLILPQAVFLRQSDGKLCSMLMFFDRNAVLTPTPAADTAPEMGEADDRSIHRRSETEFSVQRSFVEKILQDRAQIISSARIVPYEQNGQVVGVRLLAIRRGSLLGKLGLQSGDVLRSINGFELSDPASALEAYTRLRGASNLSLAVLRRGRALNFEYEVR